MISYGSESPVLSSEKSSLVMEELLPCKVLDGNRNAVASLAKASVFAHWASQ